MSNYEPAPDGCVYDKICAVCNGPIWAGEIHFSYADIAGETRYVHYFKSTCEQVHEDEAARIAAMGISL